MRIRHACINDLQINEQDRKFLWDPRGVRPLNTPSLSDLGF
jgi:nuclear transport factor 2 (NTF2) superfamily protein